MTQVQQVAVANIKAGSNDRTVFNTEQLDDLAANIREYGLIQPITVRPLADTYQIVAGERRFRAVTSLGWETIPAMVVDLADEAASAVMLAENVARADLDPIDEAKAYQSRMETYGWTLEETAQRAGVSPIRIAKRMRLLGLREEIQHLVRTGDLKEGYAAMIGSVPLDVNRQMIALRAVTNNPNPQVAWLKRVVLDLYAEQSQETAGSLFDLANYEEAAAAVSGNVTVDPPRPGVDEPPCRGVDSHIIFWESAAAEWEAQGKGGPRNECRAAVAALQNLKGAK